MNIRLSLPESYLEELERKYAGIEVEEYDISNKSELDKPITETYSFRQNNSVDIIDDKMYFSPLLFFAVNENPFKQEKREYAVDFVYPNQDKYSMTITIPEGYIVESLPVPLAIGLMNDMANFKFNISSNGKQIQVSSLLDIHSSLILPEYYADLKLFFAEMIKKQNEKIVLKKA